MWEPQGGPKAWSCWNCLRFWKPEVPGVDVEPEFMGASWSQEAISDHSHQSGPETWVHTALCKLRKLPGPWELWEEGWGTGASRWLGEPGAWIQCSFPGAWCQGCHLQSLEPLDTKVTYDLCSQEPMCLELGCNRDLYSHEPLGAQPRAGPGSLEKADFPMSGFQVVEASGNLVLRRTPWAARGGW